MEEYFDQICADAIDAIKRKHVTPPQPADEK
jgi:hypothetical protein